MEMKGLMGGFYRISEWIMRFSVTNLLWLLTSIPILLLVLVTIASPDIFSVLIQLIFVSIPVIAEEAAEETIQVALFSLMLMIVLIPFTLFPATSAMFSLARKWQIGEEDVPLFKTFFINYKQNYLQSMLAGIAYMALLVVLTVNYKFYLALDSNFQLIAPLFLALLLVTVISIFIFFALQSHLHMKTVALLKNAMLLTIGKPVTSILIVLTNLGIIYICFSFFNAFLAFFFMGSLVAYMTFFHFQRMFQKIQDKQEELAQAKEDELQVENDEHSDEN